MKKNVIKAGLEPTMKGGGSFIKLKSGGITVIGPVVKVNAGNSAENVTGIGIKPPILSGAADQDNSLMDQALVNAPSEKVKPKVFLCFLSDQHEHQF